MLRPPDMLTQVMRAGIALQAGPAKYVNFNRNKVKLHLKMYEYKRESQFLDVPELVAIDYKAYGKYGASQEYFSQKLSSPTAKVLAVENNETRSDLAFYRNNCLNKS